MEKKPFKLPPTLVLDQNQLKEQALIKEEERRFQKIAEQIIEILVKESVLVSELPQIIQMITRKINVKIDKSQISNFLNL